MHPKTTEIVTQGVINSLDKEVWNALAGKAISKMPKYKLMKQSQIMLNDFAVLNADGFIKSAGTISEDTEQIDTFKENLIVGTSKMLQPNTQRSRALPETIPIAKQKKRLTSAIQLNNKKSEDDKKKNLFRLTMPEFTTQEEQKMYDTMRTAKYDNIRYNQSLQENQKERRAMSEHRSLVQKKRFKEMKTFTYDYEGKLISLGKDKNPNAKINVVNMKPQFGNTVKEPRSSHQKPNKSHNQTMLQILNKRVVGIRTPAMQAAKQPQKQKDQRGSRHVKLLHESPNMLEYLKDGEKVQIGVTITDINNKSKFSGANRNRNQLRNAKLTEFHGQFRQLQKFRQKIMYKRLKFRDQAEPTAIRTEYIQSSNAQRIKTQVTDKQSRVFTTVTGFSKKRGKIDIKNERLYTQNFIQDLE